MIKALMRLGEAIGNIVSTIFLILFYFSVFALFAAPYRLAGLFCRQKKTTAYHEHEKRVFTKTDFEREF